MNVHRRSFLAGLGALIAAPAIVRVGSLMPVKPFDLSGIADYVGSESPGSIDVLWGVKTLHLGDVVTIEGIGAWSGPRQFRVTAIGASPSRGMLTPVTTLRPYEEPARAPELTATEAAAIGAAAVLAKNPVMSRRFWAPHA